MYVGHLVPLNSGRVCRVDGRIWMQTEQTAQTAQNPHPPISGFLPCFSWTSFHTPISGNDSANDYTNDATVLLVPNHRGGVRLSPSGSLRCMAQTLDSPGTIDARDGSGPWFGVLQCI